MTIIYDMPAAQYHAAPGISRSGLNLIAKGPSVYRHVVIEGNPIKPSAAMRLGSLVHLAVLEPDRWAWATLSAAALVADMQAKGKGPAYKEYKEALAALEAEAAAAGQEVLTPDEECLIRDIRAAIFSHPLASRMFQGGQSEVSIAWQDEITGELCRARLDYIKGNSIVELKTIGNVSEFERTCDRLRYYVQDAFYSAGWRALTGVHPSFHFAVVSTTRPIQIRTLYLDPDSKELGRMEYNRDLVTFAQCRKTQDWSDEARVERFSVSRWVFNKNNDTI